MSDWISGDCINGQRKYMRMVMQQPQYGGVDCPSILDKLVDDSSCSALTSETTPSIITQGTIYPEPSTDQATPDTLYYLIIFASMCWCICFVALLVVLTFLIKK